MRFASLSLVSYLSVASCFTIQPIGRLGGAPRMSSLDQGWDNGNFLDALSGGQKALENVNTQYQREADGRAHMVQRRLQSMAKDGMDDNNAALFGAEVEGMPDKPPKAPEHDEDNPMGGQMFKQMMERAKKGPSRPVPRTPPSTPVEPQAVAPPPPQVPVPVQPQAVAPAQVQGADPMVYYHQQLQAWQALVTSYAQLSATNPEAAAQMQMPPPPPPPPQMQMQPPPVAQQPQAPAPVQAAPQAAAEADPNKPMEASDYLTGANGNKDAYEITNPSDVYLAQLKRDSWVRTKARREGDIETANKPFEDVGVKAIGTILSDDLLQRRRKQVAENGGEFETSRDEMIIPYEEQEDLSDSQSYTGVSYKQKMEEMKKKRAARGN